MRPWTAPLLFLLLGCSARPAPPDLSDARGTDGAVASAEPHATAVGLAVLARGGNAVDAAVAVALALAVTYPAAGNLGGGGFLLLHRAGARDEVAIDFRETAPAAATRDMYLGPDGKPVEERSLVGALAAAVPGTVAGLHLALTRHGTMRWEELLEPAIRLAEEGFEVGPRQARDFEKERKLLDRFPATRRAFQPGGRFPRAGERLAQPDLASTLRALAREGPRAFYEGGIAARIVTEMERSGGLITREDLASYRAVERPPLRGSYRGLEVVSMGPPSSGGVALLEMLNLWEAVAAAPAPEPDPHLLAEVMRRAFGDRARFLGDSDFVEVPVARLTDPRYAAELARGIDRARAGKSGKGGFVHGPAESEQTTHFSVVDGRGDAIACTYTLNDGYGCGLVVEGAGFLLNNEMDDFAAAPGEPNLYGLIQGDGNAIAPRKRPLSSMTPTIVKRAGDPVLVLGSPGGPTIINSVLQVLLRVVDGGEPLDRAVAAPRLHHQWFPDRIDVERGAFPPAFLAALLDRGHVLRARDPMGNVQAIAIDGPRLHAVADPRGWGRAGVVRPEQE